MRREKGNEREENRSNAEITKTGHSAQGVHVIRYHKGNEGYFLAAQGKTTQAASKQSIAPQIGGEKRESTSKVHLGKTTTAERPELATKKKGAHVSKERDTNVPLYSYEGKCRCGAGNRKSQAKSSLRSQAKVNVCRGQDADEGIRRRRGKKGGATARVANGTRKSLTKCRRLGQTRKKGTGEKKENQLHKKVKAKTSTATRPAASWEGSEKKTPNNLQTRSGRIGRTGRQCWATHKGT